MKMFQGLAYPMIARLPGLPGCQAAGLCRVLHTCPGVSRQRYRGKAMDHGESMENGEATESCKSGPQTWCAEAS